MSRPLAVVAPRLGAAQIFSFAMVLALLAGLFGMHVLNSIQLPHAAQNSSFTAHTASTTTALERHHQLVSLTERQVPSIGSNAASAVVQDMTEHCINPENAPATHLLMHGECTPTLGIYGPSIEPPGTRAKLSDAPEWTAPQSYKRMDRVPEPPSLTKLSISRT